MDPNANRTNQSNPTHKPTGPGHQAGYQGAETNRDNRADQLNPNSQAYEKSRSDGKKSGQQK